MEVVSTLPVKNQTEHFYAFRDQFKICILPYSSVLPPSLTGMFSSSDFVRRFVLMLVLLYLTFWFSPLHFFCSLKLFQDLSSLALFQLARSRRMAVSESSFTTRGGVCQSAYSALGTSRWLAASPKCVLKQLSWAKLGYWESS